MNTDEIDDKQNEVHIPEEEEKEGTKHDESLVQDMPDSTMKDADDNACKYIF